MESINRKKNKALQQPHFKTDTFFSSFSSKLKQFSNYFESPQKARSLLQVILTCLAFSFIFSLFLCQHSIYTSKVDKSLIQLSILNHRFLSQSLETIRSDAAQNRQLLNEAQKSFKHEMTYLDDSSTEFQNVNQAWQQLSRSIDQIQAHPELLKQVQYLHLAMQLSMPEIQANYAQLIERMRSQQVPLAEIKVAQQQELLASKLLKWINTPILPEQTSPASVYIFLDDFKAFRSNIDLQLNGQSVSALNPQSRILLQNIHLEYETALQPKLDRVFQRPNEIEQLWQAYWKLPTQSEKLMDMLDEFAQSKNSLLSMLVSGLLIIFLMIMTYALIRLIGLRRAETPPSEVLQTEDSMQNQNAILRLLNEMSDFVEGDLRRQATVSEAFTGTIADALNIIVQQKKDLIRCVQHNIDGIEKAIKTLTHSKQKLVALQQNHQGLETLNQTEQLELAQCVYQLNEIIQTLRTAIMTYKLDFASE